MLQKQFGGTNNASCYPQLFKISPSKQNYDRKSTSCLIQCEGNEWLKRPGMVKYISNHHTQNSIV